MKKNFRIIVLVTLILGTLNTFSWSQNESQSIDLEREIIVMFAEGAVIPPVDRTAGKLDEFQVPSGALRQILQNANVEKISRLMPEFRPKDRFAINVTGESVLLTNWTDIYVLLLPSTQKREVILSALTNRPEVVYAEINGRGGPCLIPNDQFFTRQWALKNDGATYQGSGTPGADIKANLAWDIVTGSSTVKIGIVDIGMQANHPDFNGRVTGDAGDNSGHGTVVAGIAAAQGNNGIGIAGVAWNVGIINEDYGSNYSASDADIAAAVRSASNRGAQVINNSWRLKDPIGRYSTTVRLAFSDIYKLNRTAVAAMGNEYSELAVYPAAFGQGIIAVGATTNTDVKADYSNTGSWIDVTAPGGGGFGSFNEPQDYILSTVPGSGYAWYVDGVGIGAQLPRHMSPVLRHYHFPTTPPSTMMISNRLSGLVLMMSTQVSFPVLITFSEPGASMPKRRWIIYGLLIA